MSDYLTPALYQKRALELQWMNNIVSSHDLMCGCNKPIQHLEHCLDKFSYKECRSTTAIGYPDGGEGDHHGEEDLHIEEGDLDKLFEEPFDEDTG